MGPQIETFVKYGVLAVVCCSGCGRPPTTEMPLVDSRHTPIVLTERKALALPGAPPGNRYVQGWRFEKGDDGIRIWPSGATARIEVVLLSSRERSLVLEIADGFPGIGSFVKARSRDVVLGSFELAEDVVIPIPADLGRGRVPIQLEFSEETEIVGARVSAASPRGRVDFEGTDVIQSGWSAVDFVRWVSADARLTGEFVPPSDMKPGQKFSIAVDPGGEMPKTLFEMRAARLDSSGESQRIDLPLRDAAGLARVRLMAEGTGNAGRWLDLQLVTKGLQIRLPALVPEPPKLVVVYVLDALRADFLGYLGSSQGATPCIDRLASEGAAFINHFSVAPNTGPATKSLFTGFGFVSGRGLSEQGPETLAEVFSGHGFETASFSANPHLSPAFGLTRGFDHVNYLPLAQDHSSSGEVTINDSAGQVHEVALRWLDGRRDESPAFLYLHTLNPHNPYTPPEPFPSKFVGAGSQGLDGRTRTLASIRDLELDVTSADMDTIRQRYTSNLAYNDAEICILVDELERRYPGEVMLVVTSDHGEELFDHDGVLHGYTLYDELLHVPMVIWWPGEVAPSVIDSPTDTLDLFATLRSLVTPDESPQLEEGLPLWGELEGLAGGTGEPRVHFATAPGLRRAAMARSERSKLILVPRPRFGWGMGRGRGRTHEAEYLFRFDSDPEEHANLAGSQSLEADWLWSRLQAWLQTWQSRQPQDIDRREIDQATQRQLEALGYVD